MKYLKKIGLATLEEFAEHFWWLLAVGALWFHQWAMAVGWAICAFYFKLAEIARCLKMQPTQVEFQFHPGINPALDLTSAKTNEGDSK